MVLPTPIPGARNPSLDPQSLAPSIVITTEGMPLTCSCYLTYSFALKSYSRLHLEVDHSEFKDHTRGGNIPCCGVNITDEIHPQAYLGVVEKMHVGSFMF